MMRSQIIRPSGNFWNNVSLCQVTPWSIMWCRPSLFGTIIQVSLKSIANKKKRRGHPNICSNLANFTNLMISNKTKGFASQCKLSLLLSRIAKRWSLGSHQYMYMWNHRIFKCQASMNQLPFQMLLKSLTTTKTVLWVYVMKGL